MKSVLAASALFLISLSHANSFSSRKFETETV